MCVCVRVCACVRMSGVWPTRDLDVISACEREGATNVCVLGDRVSGCVRGRGDTRVELSLPRKALPCVPHEPLLRGAQADGREMVGLQWVLGIVSMGSDAGRERCLVYIRS